MPVRLFLASQLVRLQIRRRFAKRGDILALRGMMRAMEARVKPVPPHVELTDHPLAGVPGERLATKDADDRAALLYLHGGGFVGGSPKNHRALTWRLAHGLRVPVFALDYRLAPEHPFPAGLDDVVAAYRALAVDGRRVAIAGDSAGGNLTLAAALALRGTDAPAPAALACISPATTLVDDLPSVTENHALDAMFPPGLMASVVRHYAGATDPAHPHMSPLRAEDLEGFPPTLLQCSREEILRDHSVHMAEKLRRAGVHVELEVVPRVFHVWHVAADLVPEAARSIRRMVRFLGPRLWR